MKREDALNYHSQGRPGKIAVVATKPLTNQRDLALAYSPGVAEPCLEIVEKDIGSIRVVFSGAGAAAIATAEHYVRLGAKRENILLIDRKGVIYKGRPGTLDPYKAKFANETNARTIADALKGADVFV